MKRRSTLLFLLVWDRLNMTVFFLIPLENHSKLQKFFSLLWSLCISYVINASDLRTICLLNKLFKYADDTYLVVPASKSDTIESELQSIASWSESNNLTLNTKKSTEIVLYKPKSKMSTCHLPLFLEYKEWARWWYWGSLFTIGSPSNPILKT